MQTNKGDTNIADIVLHKLIMYEICLQQECVVTKCDNNLITDVQGVVKGVFIWSDQFEYFHFKDYAVDKNL